MTLVITTSGVSPLELPFSGVPFVVLAFLALTGASEGSIFMPGN